MSQDRKEIDISPTSLLFSNGPFLNPQNSYLLPDVDVNIQSPDFQGLISGKKIEIIPDVVKKRLVQVRPQMIYPQNQVIGPSNYFRYKLVTEAPCKMKDFTIAIPVSIQLTNFPGPFTTINLAQYPQLPFAVAQLIQKMQIKFNGSIICENSSQKPEILDAFIHPFTKVEKEFYADCGKPYQLLGGFGMSGNSDISGYNIYNIEEQMTSILYTTNNTRNTYKMINIPFWYFKSVFFSEALLPPNTELEIEFQTLNYSFTPEITFIANAATTGYVQAGPYYYSPPTLVTNPIPVMTIILQSNAPVPSINYFPYMELSSQTTNLINNFMSSKQLVIPFMHLEQKPLGRMVTDGSTKSFKVQLSVSETTPEFLMLTLSPFFTKEYNLTPLIRLLNFNVWGDNSQIFKIPATDNIQKLALIPFHVSKLTLHGQTSQRMYVDYGPQFLSWQEVQYALEHDNQLLMVESPDQESINKYKKNQWNATPIFVKLNQNIESSLYNASIPFPGETLLLEIDITDLYDNAIAFEYELNIYGCYRRLLIKDVDNTYHLKTLPSFPENQLNNFSQFQNRST